MKQPPDTIMARISFLHLTWVRHLTRALRPWGVTPKQIYLLRQLSERPYLYPAQVARLLFCDRPTATSIVNTMERRKWVKRTTDPDNRKFVRIAITAKGKKKLAAVPLDKYRTGHTEFDPISCLKPNEQQQLSRLLKKLREHLEQLNEEA